MLYGKLNLAAIDELAHSQAPNHPSINAAGRFWAESVGLNGEQLDHFASVFAFHCVQSTLIVGRSMDRYQLDIMSRPLAGQILLSTCTVCEVDPLRLPQYTSTRICPFEVTVHRGASSEQIWTADSSFDGHPIC